MGSKIEASDTALFCGQFAGTLKAGVGYLNALKILHGQLENRSLKAAAETVIDSIEEGENISDALILSGAFDECFTACVKKADERNRLSECLREFETIYKNEDRRNRLLNRGIRYPMMMTVFVPVFVFLLMAVIYPHFIAMFSGIDIEIPVFTRRIFMICGFLSDNMLIILLIFTALLAVLIIIGCSGFGGKRLSGGLFKNTVYGKIRKKILYSRFSEYMAQLLKYDHTRSEALRILSGVFKNDLFFSTLLERAAGECDDNVLLSKALEDSGFFSDVYLELVSLGEEMGNLSECLDNEHRLNLDEAQRLAERNLNIKEPLMFFIMAAVLITVILSMIQPLISMFDAVSSI
ncbi:MAG: type II secretion system F family protein [Lachnospiraceae bacterium]|nr:type II secretion system F family protein [Lachnospiraceae bacterium]